MTAALLVVALLTAVYALALASLAPLDLLTGAVLGAALLWRSRAVTLPSARPSAGELLRQLVAFGPFALVTVGNIVVGTWRVASIVVGLRPVRAQGIVKVPLGARSPTGVAVSALVESLSPGSVLIDIDWAQRVLYLHVIDASEPDQVRAQMQRFYERYQRHVFP